MAILYKKKKLDFEYENQEIRAKGVRERLSEKKEGERVNS